VAAAGPLLVDLPCMQRGFHSCWRLLQLSIDGRDKNGMNRPLWSTCGQFERDSYGCVCEVRVSSYLHLRLPHQF
jgi:hypothetical protein